MDGCQVLIGKRFAMWTCAMKRSIYSSQTVSVGHDLFSSEDYLSKNRPSASSTHSVPSYRKITFLIWEWETHLIYNFMFYCLLLWGHSVNALYDIQMSTDYRSEDTAL